MNDKVAGMIEYECLNGVSVSDLKERMARNGVNHVVTLETIIEMLMYESLVFHGVLLHSEIT